MDELRRHCFQFYGYSHHRQAPDQSHSQAKVSMPRVRQPHRLVGRLGGSHVREIQMHQSLLGDVQPRRPPSRASGVSGRSGALQEWLSSHKIPQIQQHRKPVALENYFVKVVIRDFMPMSQLICIWIEIFMLLMYLFVIQERSITFVRFYFIK